MLTKSTLLLFAMWMFVSAGIVDGSDVHRCVVAFSLSNFEYDLAFRD